MCTFAYHLCWEFSSLFSPLLFEWLPVQSDAPSSRKSSLTFPRSDPPYHACLTFFSHDALFFWSGSGAEFYPKVQDVLSVGYFLVLLKWAPFLTLLFLSQAVALPLPYLELGCFLGIGLKSPRGQAVTCTSASYLDTIRALGIFVVAPALSLLQASMFLYVK